MNKVSKIQAVIFDMDGVLADSESLICTAAMEMFREMGVAVCAEDFRPFVGMGEDRYLGEVARRHGMVLDLPAAKKRTYEIYLALIPSLLHAFPGAAELVRDCRADDLFTAVASSADPIKIAANLRQIGLPAAEWDAVVAGDEVIHKKPEPDLFLEAAARLKLSPEQCVVVEDAVSGVLAAKAAGMRCVAVAHTFAADALALADVVRPAIAQVSLADLTGKENHSSKSRPAEG